MTLADARLTSVRILIHTLDPAATSVIYAAQSGNDDDGEFVIIGPLPPENVDAFYETIPGGGTLHSQDARRELIAPERIFQLVTMGT